MKLPQQTAGLAASGTLSMAILVGMIQHMDPVNLLWIALPASLITGFIGFQLGKTFNHPKGKPKQKDKKNGRKGPQGTPEKTLSVTEATEYKAITGNESFLSDLDSPSKSVLTDSSLPESQPEATSGDVTPIETP